MLHGAAASGVKNHRNQAGTDKIMISVLSSPSKREISIPSRKSYT